MILAAAATALLLAAAPARAEDPSALASQLSRMVLTEENYQRITADTARGVGQAVAASQGEAIAAGGPAFQEELNKGMADVVNDLMPTYQEMVDMQAGLLAKHYTAKELRELLAFYRTPLGQKLIRSMPEVTADVMAWMQTIMQQRMPAAGARFQARMEAWTKARGGAGGQGRPLEQTGEAAPAGPGER